MKARGHYLGRTSLICKTSLTITTEACELSKVCQQQLPQKAMSGSQVDYNKQMRRLLYKEYDGTYIQG